MKRARLAATVFACLLGVTSASAQTPAPKLDLFGGYSDSEIAFGGGAGVDVNINPRLAFRAQLDLLGSFADIVEGNTRFATGLVLTFGVR